MLWRLGKGVVLLGLVIAVAIYVSSGSLSNWQEVRQRLLAASGSVSNIDSQVSLPPTPVVPLDATESVETREVVLYFTDASGASLLAEKRNIPKVEGIGKETLQELIAGPKDKDKYPVMPQGINLLGVNVKPDGLCIVDFGLSPESFSAQSSVQEKTTVYAIVNTLTQFPSVQRVKILINGQEKITFGDKEVISGELMRDETIIK
jgi:spore germination protein GerM